MNLVEGSPPELCLHLQIGRVWFPNKQGFGKIQIIFYDVQNH